MLVKDSGGLSVKAKALVIELRKGRFLRILMQSDLRNRSDGRPHCNDLGSTIRALLYTDSYYTFLSEVLNDDGCPELGGLRACLSSFHRSKCIHEDQGQKSLCLP